MTSEKLKEQNAVRFPWVALTLSFLSSGVGHLYCGRITKGLFLYSARFLLPVCWVIAAFMQPSSGVLLGMIILPAVATVAVFLYSAFDAFAIARRTDPDYGLKDYNRASLYWMLIAMQLAYPVALTWGIREYAFEAFIIPTASMSPGILPGDRILVNKQPLRDVIPSRGDLIVFRPPISEPAEAWIKRVIGVAGDEILIKERQIEVNGKKLEHQRVPMETLSYLRGELKGDVYDESHSGRRYQVHYDDVDAAEQNGTEQNPEDSESEEFRITVPDRSVFVLGDNRDRSRDSRHIGTVPVGDVIGYVDYIFYPANTWSRFGAYRDSNSSR